MWLMPWGLRAGLCELSRGTLLSTLLAVCTGVPFGAGDGDADACSWLLLAASASDTAGGSCTGAEDSEGEMSGEPRGLDKLLGCVDIAGLFGTVGARLNAAGDPIVLFAPSPPLVAAVPAPEGVPGGATDTGRAVMPSRR